MTVNEFREALNKLSDEEYDEFQNKYGGEKKSKEDRIKDFVYLDTSDKGKHEMVICYYLGLKTEAEKQVESSVKAAKAALLSAESSKKAANSSKISAIFLGISLLISITLNC